MKKFLLLSFLLSASALAQADESLPSCGKESDKMCSNIWSKDNRGNKEVFDGKILFGTSPKSQMAMSKLLDYQALVASLPRLPNDLKEKAAPVIAELATTLANERDDQTWYGEASLSDKKMENAVNAVAMDRFLIAYPEMKGVKYDDFTTTQISNFRSVLYKLQDQLIDAKYLEHENWKRVQALYPKIQEALVAEIQKLKVSQDRKDFMLSQIRSAKLTLPYTDPSKSTSPEECATTQTNAYYQGQLHHFVVCAGLFNTVQSPSAIAVIISHEIGHALDSGSQTNYDKKKNSQINAALNKLVGAKGPVYSCEEWQKLVSEVFVTKKDIVLRNLNPFENLYQCVQSRARLQPFTTESVRYAANYLATTNVGRYSDYHSFIYLAQPSFDKYGKTVINESYLRPDIEHARLYGSFDPGWDREAEISEIFVQSLACQKASPDAAAGIAAASAAEKPNLFQAALNETTAIVEAKTEDDFTFCGQNCNSLAQFRLAAPPHENTADWFAFRAFPHILRSVDKPNRLEASMLSTALFCVPPDVTTQAPEFAAMEKKFSQESHPDDRIRRVSNFLPETAELAGCSIDESSKGYGVCEP